MFEVSLRNALKSLAVELNSENRDETADMVILVCGYLDAVDCTMAAAGVHTSAADSEHLYCHCSHS